MLRPVDRNCDRLSVLRRVTDSGAQGVLALLESGEEVLLALTGIRGAVVVTGSRLILVQFRPSIDGRSVGLRSVPFAKVRDYRLGPSKRGGVFYATVGDRPRDRMSLIYRRDGVPDAADLDALLRVLMRRERDDPGEQEARVEIA
jgi:hypothetical protein